MKGLWFVLLLGLDVLSKVWALKSIPIQGISIFDFSFISFSLDLVTNSGAAWGFFQGHSALLFWIRVGITLFLIANILYFSRGKLAAVPVWLIITGAVGNQIDYVAYGHVIDFLHFSFWGKSFPIFNFADCYITLGVLAFVLWDCVKPVRS